MIIYDCGGCEKEEEKRYKDSANNSIGIKRRCVDVSTSSAETKKKVKKIVAVDKIKKLTVKNRKFLVSLGLKVK